MTMRGVWPAFVLVCWAALSASGEIYNWSTGEVISGTEGITPGPGIELDEWNTDDRHLRYADFTGGLNLQAARFDFSWLDYARFGGANLTGASFQKARLGGADFSGADLTDADLGGADMAGVNLEGATVCGASFAFLRTSVGSRLTAEQLYSTASYQARDLHGVRLAGLAVGAWSFADQDLRAAELDGVKAMGADFSGADLTCANLMYSRLNDADFTDAVIAEADFNRRLITTGGFTGTGLTPDQLCSTASYQKGDLHGVKLDWNELRGVDLNGQNLTDASFFNAYLEGGDLSRADLRGAVILSSELAETVANGTILPDGVIAGLNLGAGGTLPVRDYDGGIVITVNDELRMTSDAVIQIILADDSWGSTISLADGVAADLDGILRLTFADGVDVDALVGTTFDLFDWNGGLSIGDAFASVQWTAGHVWDLSDLYVGGTATLISVPEPGALALLLIGALAVRRR